MTLPCTWDSCANQRGYPYHGPDGRIVAFLCGHHSRELDAALRGENKYLTMCMWKLAKVGMEKK